jgi:hypothetical protein
LSKSNAKKLASFAETPPKITTESRKNEDYGDGERFVHRLMYDTKNLPCFTAGQASKILNQNPLITPK